MSHDTLSRQPAAASVIADAAVCATAAMSIATTTALFVLATGLGDDARRALRFGFGGVDRSVAEASRIAIHNARFAGGTLLCAALAPRLPTWTRVLIDLLLATLLAFNAGAVGLAFGAYGWRALFATAPHLSLEFGGLSLAGGAYLHARRRPLPPRALAAVVGCCGLLLAAAAVLETYVSMRGPR
jgi:hypothetical protein